MEISGLVLDIVGLTAIVVLVVAFIKQKRALAKHVCKLKKTLEALKENLEQQIKKAVSGKVDLETKKNILVGPQRRDFFGGFGKPGFFKRFFGTDFFVNAKKRIKKRRKISPS